MTEIKTNTVYKVVDSGLFWVSMTLLALVFIRGFKEVYIEDVMKCAKYCEAFNGFNKIYFDISGKKCECNNKMSFKLN